MTAVIVTVEPGKAWISTDGLAAPQNGDPPFELGPKWGLLPDGTAVAGAGDLHTLDVFARWCRDVRGANRLAEAPRWLRNTGQDLTVFLIEPGRAWALSYENSYQPQALTPGVPACRPGLPDPSPLRGISDPLEMHKRYLELAAEACRAGAIKPPNGARCEIGGHGWTCLLTEAGAELVELGELG